MSAVDAPPPEPSVSWRELAILAAISLSTVLAMTAAAEVGTRLWWPEQERNPCLSLSLDRPRPGCTAQMKNAEGPWTTVTYNDCGYRSAQPCGQKPAGTRRVMIMGASVSEGMYVRYEDYFGGRLERDLSAQCGFPVQTQSVGSMLIPANLQARLLPEVLALHPDVVLMPVNPFDMVYFSDDEPLAEPDAAAVANPPAQVKAATVVPHKGPVRDETENQSVLTRLRVISRDSRALLIGQHFLLQNDTFLFKAYQLGREEDALRVPPSKSFVRRYTRLEKWLRSIQRVLAARGIPLVVVPVPNRIQAALISDKVTLPHVDAWAFTREVQAIAARICAPVADPFPLFAAQPHAERMFYAVDGHPDGDAHALIAQALEASLTDGSMRSFAACGDSR